MRLVRLYVTQNSSRWHEDVPHEDYLTRTVDLELEGAVVYHASELTPARPARRKAAVGRCYFS